MAACGTHTVLDLHGCDPRPLNDSETVCSAALEAMRSSGAIPLHHHFGPMEPAGIRGIVLASNAHLSVHTSPETAFAAVDLFTGDDEVDVDRAASVLQRRLDSREVVQARHDRGTGNLDAETEPLALKVRWFTEYHRNPAAAHELLLGFSYAVDEQIAHQRSRFQDIRVLRNPVWGRTLVLDGVVNVTERDEFAYHEMLGHVPLLLHGAPTHVLVIGGGDGGLVREVLKHHDVEAVDLVELDPLVVQLSRTHLPRIARTLGDPRVHIHHLDGMVHVRDSAQKYDVILVDATDPLGPGRVLYSKPFYLGCRNLLRPGGLFAAQGLSPWLQVDEQRNMFSTLRQVFGDVRPYLSTVPTYPGGQWVFALASDFTLEVECFDEDAAEHIAAQCQYYNAQIHTAAFALPNFIRRQLDDDET
ncbi:MAG: polyamine aminopropyltransferase [Pseudomonadota bacterium]